MGKYTNSYVLRQILLSLFHVAGRRTTKSFALKVIGSIIRTLSQKFEFLSYIEINDDGEGPDNDSIIISADIDIIHPDKIGRAIEAIVRVVYMDIIGKAGLFFIAELKKRAGEELITELYNFGVDLATLQIEQHYLYRSREKKKQHLGQPFDDVSLLGYTWKNVTSWKYDTNKKSCILYNKEGEVLDNLHLDSIIENYVKNLSNELDDGPEEIENVTIAEKEFELMKILQTRDMDAETAMVMLHIDKSEFYLIVKKLLENDFLQYTSHNIIELTEIGLNYLLKNSETKSADNKPVEELVD
jgi:hypothetical protein